ncbi:MAG: nucleotidyltransferase domain-containing protein [Nanoarchaeota archaeon]
METLIRQAREVGTSAGVLLPRRWLNKQVVVTLHYPALKDIAQDIIKILFEENLNEEIKGIYLTGSYARGDYDFNSDIDVLVITSNVNKIIKNDKYEIILVSESNFSKNLFHNLNYLSSLKEAKVIINKELLKEYQSMKIKPNFKYLLKEIEKIIKINQDTILTCNENNQQIPDGVIYSIVLRLRELYLIKCIILGKQYNKEVFLKLVGENSYNIYNRVKRDEKELNNISYEEAYSLINLSSKWLKEVRD